MIKVTLGVIAALFIAVIVGWLWGASGKADLNQALRGAELRTDLLDGRGSVLAARVDIYNVNFGEASRHLEQARNSLDRCREALQLSGREDDVQRLNLAVARIDEAQRAVRQLNQDAQSRAAEAVRIIDEILATTRKT